MPVTHEVASSSLVRVAIFCLLSSAGLEHKPSKFGVAGSSPAGDASFNIYSYEKENYQISLCCHNALDVSLSDI